MDWYTWHHRHGHWLRWICWLRGHHEEETEFGGGADIIRCKICDAAKTLRIYGYGKVPDTIYYNPQWR